MVFDVAGKASFDLINNLLAPGGSYLLANFRPIHTIKAKLSFNQSNGKKLVYSNREASLG